MNVFHSFVSFFRYRVISQAVQNYIFRLYGIGHIFGVFIFMKLTLVEGFIMTHKFNKRSITTTAGQHHRRKRNINKRNSWKTYLLLLLSFSFFFFSEDKKWFFPPLIVSAYCVRSCFTHLFARRPVVCASMHNNRHSIDITRWIFFWNGERSPHWGQIMRIVCSASVHGFDVEGSFSEIVSSK